MKLFEIAEDYQVKLNKEWIMLIPELAEIIRRDRGSKGDTQARFKLKARREFTFIYFFKAFESPIFTWEEDERFKEALNYAGISDKDANDPVLIKAMDKFDELQNKASRSLRTLRSAYKGMDALDKHFEEVDFSAVDKDGRQLHSPDKFTRNISTLNKTFDELDKFAKRVEAELQQSSSGIRGAATKGVNEDKVRKWSESDIRQGSNTAAGPDSRGRSMKGLMKIIHERNKETFTEEELDEETA